MSVDPIPVFEKVCSELRLPSTPDWGIIHADPSRVIEFIDFVSSRELPKEVRYTFIELVIASLNEKMLEGEITDAEHMKFEEYIEPLLFDPSYYPMCSYWVGIRSEEEYPVGCLLLEIARGRTILS